MNKAPPPSVSASPTRSAASRTTCCGHDVLHRDADRAHCGTQSSGATLDADEPLIFDALPWPNDLEGALAAGVRFVQHHVIAMTPVAPEAPHVLTSRRKTLLLVRPQVALVSLQVTGIDRTGTSIGALAMHPPEQLPKTVYHHDDASDGAAPADDEENQRLVYAENVWSVELPPSWIEPGLQLHFDSPAGGGQLADIRVGAPVEVLLHTIDIGMLTPPRNAFRFAGEPALQREYFQTVPLRKLIVNQYEAIHWQPVMLPDGTLLTDNAPDEGDWHQGTFRALSWSLISSAIHLANLGQNASSGSEDAAAHDVAQFTVSNVRGNYANGVVTHGGIAYSGFTTTVEFSEGNEFSHEVGHVFHLDHYPGGFDGSIHRAAGQPNSTWGWDMDLHRFIPNFFPGRSGEDTCQDDICEPPFHDRSFGRDAMAGGEPFSDRNRYTLHTPYSTRIVHDALSGYRVFSAESPTGYRAWDAESQTMQAAQTLVRTKDIAYADYADLGEAALAALLATADIVRIDLTIGYFVESIHVPAASAANRTQAISIEGSVGYPIDLHINGQTIVISEPVHLCFVSDGERWDEGYVPLYDWMARARARNASMNETYMGVLFEQNNLVEIHITDEDWVADVAVPQLSLLWDRIVVINHDAENSTTLAINGQSMPISRGQSKVFRWNFSDERWVEYGHTFDTAAPRTPSTVGVPVTTLVGFYDPQGTLPAHIFPALHGAYGMLHEADGDVSATCRLVVDGPGGEQHFRLFRSRGYPHEMNKFHVNIPESTQARSAYVVVNGAVVAQLAIQPAASVPQVFVYGE